MKLSTFYHVYILGNIFGIKSSNFYWMCRLFFTQKMSTRREVKYLWTVNLLADNVFCAESCDHSIAFHVKNVTFIVWRSSTNLPTCYILFIKCSNSWKKNNKILLSFLSFKLNFFFNSTHKTTAFNIIFKGKGLIKHENSYFQHLIIPLNSKYLHKK